MFKSKLHHKTIRKCLMLCMCASMFLSGCGDTEAIPMNIAERADDKEEHIIEAEETEEVVGKTDEPEEFPETDIIETLAEDFESTQSTYDRSVGPIIAEYAINTKNSRKPYTVNFYQYNIETGDKKLLFIYDSEVSFGAAQYGFIPNQYGGLIATAEAWRYRQLFSPDMTMLAVQFSQSDGSERIGWRDSDGTVVDVSELIHPASDDFAGTVPHDWSPIFSPEGELIFLDKNIAKLLYFDPSSGGELREEDALVDSVYGTVESQFFYLPSGTLRENIRSTSSYSSSYSSSFQDYAGDDATTLWIVEDGSTSKNHIFKRRGEDPFNYYTEIQITPDSEYYIQCCSYYNGRIAFIAYRSANEYALFVMDDSDDIGTVTKVCDLPMDYSGVKDWQHEGYGAIFW